MKILLIYPTRYKLTGLPAGLASLSSSLKKEGHKVKIFNTSFYPDKKEGDQTKLRAKIGMSKTVEDIDKYHPNNTTNMEEDLISLVKEYKPDLIGISVLEIVYELSLHLARLIKNNFKEIPIIVGGVFPTLSPELFINEEQINIVCLGEGEVSLVELCRKLSKKENYENVEGMWIKKNGKIYKNKPSKLIDINELSYPDYSEFDKRLFYKPMQGKMYKMLNIVTSRGCGNKCAFCAAPQLRKFFDKYECGRYNRLMDMKNIIDQLHIQIKKYNPEFIYFSSENFLAMSDKNFDLFIEEYEKIKIPFWIQTRIETITKKRLSELKRVGMLWLSIGLEHGNEEFRNNFLKRRYTNKMFIEKTNILKELDMGASVNNMLGFPLEDRELIFDTIKVNRKLWLKNPKLECNIFIFVPFKGCELYNICKDKGLIDGGVILSSNVSGKSVLKFSEDFQKDIKGLSKTFNLYVKLSEKYYDQIKIAEQDNEEGNRMFKKLLKVLN